MTNIFNEKYYEHLTEEDLANEIWKPIEDFPNYMISNLGRVKSLERLVKCRGGYRTVNERILKPGVNRYGYLYVGLCKDGKVKSMTVHRLVAIAFIPNPENKPEVNHLNGKTDNRVCSLEFVTREENEQHAIDTGLLNNVGENNGSCKLTDEDCESIKIKYATGNYTQKEIGDEYGISQIHVSDIVRGKRRAKQTPSLTH